METSNDDDLCSFGDLEDEFTATDSKHRQEESSPVIAKRESRRVLHLRLLVLLVLVLAAITTALLIYFYIVNSERIAFEQQFSEFSAKVVAGVGSTFETTFGAIDVLSASILSHAHYSGQKWPNVFTPDFAYRAAKVRPLSKSFFIGLLVVVTPDQRAEWEASTLENGGADIWGHTK